MTPVALSAYSVALSLHIMAVVAAFGLPLAYPLLIPYVRRAHPRAMPGLHDVQHRLNLLLTGPGTVLVLVLGAYMATRRDHWREVWVMVPLAIIAVIAVLGGWIVPATARLAALARTDVEAAGSGGAVAWGAEYARLYRSYMAVEVLLGMLVLTAVFFMAAKPFA